MDGITDVCQISLIKDIIIFPYTLLKSIVVLHVPGGVFLRVGMLRFVIVSPSIGVRLDQDDYVAPTQVVDGSRA